MTATMDPPRLDYPPAFVAPAHLWVPERRGTYGPEIVEFAAEIGNAVDAEQAAALDALASYGRGGNYLTLETVDLEGRQQGKTVKVELNRALADLFLFGAETITWTAHQLDTCRAAFELTKQLIDSNDSLSSRVKEISEQRTEWAVELMSGATIEFRSRAGGGGRGRTGDIWHVDEALFVTGAMMGDRLPTLSSRPNPQVRYSSSGSKAVSSHLRSLAKRGRAMNDPTLIFLEYCAPGSFREPPCEKGAECSHRMGTPGCVGDDESLWHLANHSAGKRTAYTFLRAERRTLPPEEWLRERYGWHEDGPGDDGEPPFPAGTWEKCSDPLSERSGPPTLAVDVSPDRSYAAVSMCATRADGLPMVRVVRLGRGVDWVPAQVGGIVRDKGAACVVVESIGPGSNLHNALIEAIDDVPLVVMSTGDVCDAWASLYDGISTKRVRHCGQSELDAAVGSATTRAVGARKAWDRKTANADITALVSVTHAYWGHLTQVPQPFFASRR